MRGSVEGVGGLPSRALPRQFRRKRCGSGIRAGGGRNTGGFCRKSAICRLHEEFLLLCGAEEIT